MMEKKIGAYAFIIGVILAIILGLFSSYVAEYTEAMPKAIFRKEMQKIRIELKGEIREEIDAEIRQLAQKYGYGSHSYFRAVRKMSIQYWVNLERKHMFEVYNDLTGEKIL